MEKGKLFVISGPSGVGKGTICQSIMERKPFRFSVSMTTRAPREGEIDGVHYHFVSKEQFDTAIRENQLLEYASAYGNYYGTPKAPVLENLNQGVDMLLDIEMKGALQVKEAFPEAVLIFVLPPSREALIDRLQNRGSETEESLARRVGNFLEELNYIGHYDYFLINGDLEVAVSDCLGIMNACHGNGSAENLRVPRDPEPLISRYK